MKPPELILYTDSSPNGFKITIALEELDVPYTLRHVQIDQGEHRHAAFLELNPHGRIPVLVDEGTGIVLFESAAILLYLAEKFGRLLPDDHESRWLAITWLMFHASSMGPLLGQRVHYELFDSTPNTAVIDRYQRLTEDTFATLDARLQHNDWLAGREYSIADIATFGWMHIVRIIAFDFSRYPHLSDWYARANQRPAVQRGIRLPAPATGP
ncbi:glutathione S-transferase family protein [Pseudomonas sp. GD03860]|uniref:glutathione S-transferase family protein n=1 Tax=Pseudomonas TaxID=286 RepID=UPI00236447BE|nr:MULTISPECIES: glutathione S-transferase family protein [Pseudomonas]MDD2060813.1 glutathione S-transferase family protein [Pseudomonas putida]MDH0638295.1 glutathione S-transferase family protein [Pseudomonas sp. GD03860]